MEPGQGGAGASVDHRREPCPDRIIDDVGGAFGMGAVGGGVWHLIKGIKNSPSGARMLGGVQARPHCTCFCGLCDAAPPICLPSGLSESLRSRCNFEALQHYRRSHMLLPPSCCASRHGSDELWYIMYIMTCCCRAEYTVYLPAVHSTRGAKDWRQLCGVGRPVLYL